jgi:hypothetical protein
LPARLKGIVKEDESADTDNGSILMEGDKRESVTVAGLADALIADAKAILIRIFPKKLANGALKKY